MRVPPQEDRPASPRTGSTARDEGIGWNEVVGFVQGLAKGVTKADELSKIASNPQGQVGLAAGFAAKLAKRNGMNRETFLAVCGMAFDE